MPLIDVNDVILDADVAGEAFVVIRREEIIEQGLAKTIPTEAQAYGNIQPAGDNELMREADFDTQTQSIDVYTPYRLRGAGQDAAGVPYKPDLILWQGDTYIVQTVEEWTQYGRGYIKAHCTAENTQTVAP